MKIEVVIRKSLLRDISEKLLVTNLHRKLMCEYTVKTIAIRFCRQITICVE